MSGVDHIVGAINMERLDMGTVVATATFHLNSLSLGPIETLLQPIKEPLVVVCPIWTSRIIAHHQVLMIMPYATHVDFMRFYMVLTIQLKEGTILLLRIMHVFSCVTTILHDDFIIRWLATIVILVVLQILVRLTIEVCRISH